MTKKLVALVMALMMLLSVTALAETADTSDWETYRFEDAQLTISCPADMAVVELTDEQTEAGICFATADTAYSLEGRNAKWRFRFYDGYDLCWRENKLILPAEWTVVSYDPTGGGTGDYFTVAK